jgi:hypothetical protein
MCYARIELLRLICIIKLEYLILLLKTFLMPSSPGCLCKRRGISSGPWTGFLFRVFYYISVLTYYNISYLSCDV